MIEILKTLRDAIVLVAIVVLVFLQTTAGQELALPRRPTRFPDPHAPWRRNSRR